MTIREAAVKIKSFIKANMPNEHIIVRCTGEAIQFTNLPMMVEARGLAEQATGLKFEACGFNVVRLVRADHEHRDRVGNPQPCEKSKVECDAWHRAVWEQRHKIDRPALECYEHSAAGLSENEMFSKLIINEAGR